MINHDLIPGKLYVTSQELVKIIRLGMRPRHYSFNSMPPNSTSKLICTNPISCDAILCYTGYSNIQGKKFFNFLTKDKIIYMFQTECLIPIGNKNT